MISSEQRESYIENKKLTLLTKSLASNMPGTLITCIVISIILWETVPTNTILIWLSANIIFVIIRYIGLWIYHKGFKANDTKFWKILLFISFIIAGTLFGSSVIFLATPERAEYTIFLYLVAGAMVSGSLGAYHKYIPIFIAYSGTVFLIPTVVLYNMDTTITTTMSLLGILFYLISFLNAKKMNQDLTETLGIRYDNNMLVRKINIEKKHVELLNAQLIEKNHELKSLTRVDPLTGLKNRRYLFEEFTPYHTKLMEKRWINILGKNKRSSKHYGYGIFMMDIDKFKTVNDNFGHDSGDMVLKQFSSRLIEKVREDDVVARVGGEEFLIVLKDTDKNYLPIFAETVRNYIESIPFNITQDRTINITTSIGFIFYPFFDGFPIKMNFEQMISLADKGLYYAKQNGRNISVRIGCTEQKSSDLKVVDAIASDIPSAIEQKKIYFEISTKRD